MLEGGEVLHEFSGTLGYLLWQSLGDVTLWAAAAPAERAELFPWDAGERRGAEIAATGVAIELEQPLHAIARLLADPAATEPDAVLQACRGISEWADARGAPGTAVEFAQAGALAAPTDAAAAYVTGRLVRQRADFARAQTWFQRAVVLARQNDDWDTYARTFVGMGNLYLQRGNFPRAKKRLERALRTAQRHGLKDVEGMAFHDLFHLAMEAGRAGDAESYAARAFAAYGADHPRLPGLAHDVAYFWISEGHFGRALPVLRVAIRSFRSPADRLSALANIVRAAGAIGDRAAFEDAWAEAWHLLRPNEEMESSAPVLLDLARGAASLHDFGRAELAASRALRLAADRGQARIQLSAEAVIDALKRQSAASQGGDTYSSEAAEDRHPLAESLIRSLEAGAAAPGLV